MNAPGSFEFGADLAGRTTRLMAYALLAIILMSLDYRERWVGQAHASIGLLVEPVLLLIEWPYRSAGKAGEALANRQQLLNEARALRLELDQMSARLLLLEDLRLENAELRALLIAGERVDTGLVAAEIRWVDLNPFSHRVLINRGRRDGLVAGQPVVDTNGLVGQVDEVFLHSARVILLTDPDHALPVRVQRTGLRTVAYGGGLSSDMRLMDLPMNVDLEPGDIVMTSGLGGVFPAGLPVALVESIERPSGDAFASAVLRPLGRPERSRYLLVLDPMQEPLQEPLLESELPAEELAVATDRPAEITSEIEP